MALLSNVNLSVKWAVLVTLCTLSFINAFQWGVYAAVVSESNSIFNMDHDQVNILSLLYTLSWIPCLYPSMFLQKKFGPHGALVAGSGCNMVGAGLKLFAVLVCPDTYPIHFIGHLFSGFSEVFFLPLPSLLASTWFPAHLRSKAASVASLCNSLGVAGVFLVLPSFLKNDPKEGFFQVFLWQAILSLINLLVILFVLPSAPAVLPSATATKVNVDGENRSSASLKEIWACFQQLLQERRNYFPLAFSGAALVGTGWTLSAFVTQILEPYGVTETSSGVMVSLFSILGALGQFGIGILVDKTRKYKPFLLIQIAGSIVCLLGLLLSLLIGINETIAGYLFIPTFGIFFISAIPLLYEYIVEITYPIPIAVPMLLYTASVRILFGMATNRIMARILTNHPTTYRGNICLVVNAVIYAVAFASMWMVKDECRRRDQDQRNSQQQVQEEDAIGMSESRIDSSIIGRVGGATELGELHGYGGTSGAEMTTVMKKPMHASNNPSVNHIVGHHSSSAAAICSPVVVGAQEQAPLVVERVTTSAKEETQVHLYDGTVS